jgi:D-amino peptidase
MKVLISVDMEGISGVVIGDHTHREHKEWDRMRKLMTAEANAAIEGALEGGATEIVVNDRHGSMTNIMIEDLNPRADLISGRQKPLGMIQGIGPDVNAVFLIGYHASVGTTDGVLAHTWSGVVSELRLNGTVVGETGLNSAVAGGYGVPVVLVAGDRAVTDEAKALLGTVETVAVKDGVSTTAARCMNPAVAREKIRAAAARAVRAGGKPFVLKTPITMRLTIKDTAGADMVSLMPGVKRLDGRVFEWTGKDMHEIYGAFQAMTTLAARP